jgi:hypothetical protein
LTEKNKKATTPPQHNRTITRTDTTATVAVLSVFTMILGDDSSSLLYPPGGISSGSVKVGGLVSKWTGVSITLKESHEEFLFLVSFIPKLVTCG